MTLPLAIKNMNTFKKEERLCSKKFVDLLFKNGSSFLLYPFRLTYLPFVPDPGESRPFPVQVVINVAKKRYKRAVDRNLIKRRIREVYRLQKANLLYRPLKQHEKNLLLSVQFVGKTKYPSAFLAKKLQLALQKLSTLLVPLEALHSETAIPSDQSVPSDITKLDSIQFSPKNTSSHESH